MPIPIFNQTISGNIIDLAGGGNYKLSITDQQSSIQNVEIRLICKTLGGAINILLPTIASLGNTLGLKVFIDDASDLAGTNNITVYTDPTNTIANEGTLVIKTNGGKSEIYVASRTEYGILGGGSGGGVYDTWTFNVNGDVNDGQISVGTPNTLQPLQVQLAQEREYKYTENNTVTAKNLTVKVRGNDVGTDVVLVVTKMGLPTPLTLTIPALVGDGDIITSSPLASFTFELNDNIALAVTGGNEGGGFLSCKYCTMEIEG